MNPWDVFTWLNSVLLACAAVAIFIFFLRDVGEFMNPKGPDKE